MKHAASDFLDRGAIIGENRGSRRGNKFANALRSVFGDRAQGCVAIDAGQSLPNIGQRCFGWEGEDDVISIAA